MDYWCPELEELGEYHAMPATVWAVGLMLYVMMFWALPGAITREQINNHQWERDDLSPGEIFIRTSTVHNDIKPNEDRNTRESN